MLYNASNNSDNSRKNQGGDEFYPIPTKKGMLLSS